MMHRCGVLTWQGRSPRVPPGLAAKLHADAQASGQAPAGAVCTPHGAVAGVPIAAGVQVRQVALGALSMPESLDPSPQPTARVAAAAEADAAAGNLVAVA